MFVNCIKRRKVALWLKKELRKLGSYMKMDRAIRSDFGPAANSKKAMLLVAVVVDMVWKGRGEGMVPTTNFIRRIWEKEIKKQK